MNGALPDWLQSWLGVDSVPGEGTAWSLAHAWPWPPWATLLILGALLLVVVGVYRREGRASRLRKVFLAALRLASLAVVLVMIAQVALALQRTGLPYVAVLLDNSQSMAAVDRYPPRLAETLEQRTRQAGFGEPSRWNVARALLLQRDATLLRGLAEQYRLRLYYLDKQQGVRGSEAADVETLVGELRSQVADVPRTALGTAARAILEDLRGTPPAALVVFSDGINTEGPALADAAADARRRGVPLFAVGIGDQRPRRWLQLRDLLVDEAVFVQDVIDFEFRLATAGLEGRKVAVVLRRQGQAETLARVEVVVSAAEAAQVIHLPYRPQQAGRVPFVLEATAVDDDTVEPARLKREIDVRDEKIRVLLAQAYPNFEFRYLHNLLSRDETVELRSVLQEADAEHVAQDARALRLFPVRREDLFAYDVVILGDVNPALIGEASLAHVAEFVNQKQKGGALVVLAGPRYMPLAFRGTPLEPLLPIELAAARAPAGTAPLTAGYTARPTPLGLSLPPLQLGATPAETARIWQSLPPLYWLLQAPEVKPGARVLLERPAGDGAQRAWPVVLMQYVGAGRVWMHLTDSTWRWRKLTGDQYFGRYWIQTIRFLARGKLTAGQRRVELTTPRREQPSDEPLELRATFADDRLAPAEDDGVTVVIEQAGAADRRVKLRRVAGNRGMFETTLADLPPGEYHAWLAVPPLDGPAPAADFRLVMPAGENLRTPVDAAALRQAAEATKGRFYTLENVDRLAAELPEGRQVPIETLPPRSLWDRWPVLALLVVLLGLEWFVRKRSGMV